MLAMQYSFPLADDFDMTQIRRRVAQKGPLFDRYPGLLQKAFLCNDVTGQILGDRIGNEYGAFYLWDSAAAARDFLVSDAFKAVSEAFGRPRVQSWQVLGQHSRGGSAPRFAVQGFESLNCAADVGLIALAERQAVAPAFQQPGRHSIVVAFDPYRWELTHFTLWREARDAQAARNGNSQSFEVLHLSEPGGATKDAGLSGSVDVASLAELGQPRQAFL